MEEARVWHGYLGPHLTCRRRHSLTEHQYSECCLVARGQLLRLVPLQHSVAAMSTNKRTSSPDPIAFVPECRRARDLVYFLTAHRMWAFLNCREFEQCSGY
jgi:hypothetical protein